MFVILNFFEDAQILNAAHFKDQDFKLCFPSNFLKAYSTVLNFKGEDGCEFEILEIFAFKYHLILITTPNFQNKIIKSTLSHTIVPP